MIENTHTMICTFPRGIAFLFQKYPDLVVKAARAFLYRDDADVKVPSMLQRVLSSNLHPLVNKAIALMKTLKIVNETYSVNIPVRFTR